MDKVAGFITFAAVYKLRFYFDWLKHFIVANSRHGTHSPCVYRLVDEVIYADRQPDEPGDKVQRLIGRLIRRFEPEQIYAPGGHVDPGPVVDFAVIDGHSREKNPQAEVDTLWPRFHPGSVLVLTGCHDHAKALWLSLKARPDVTVTIDLFHVGLVFFRKGQAKENFIIRF